MVASHDGFCLVCSLLLTGVVITGCCATETPMNKRTGEDIAPVIFIGNLEAGIREKNILGLPYFREPLCSIELKD